MTTNKSNIETIVKKDKVVIEFDYVIFPFKVLVMGTQVISGMLYIVYL